MNVRADDEQVAPTANDPLSAIKCLSGMVADEDDVTILVLRNFHRFTGSAEIVQALDSAISQGKVNRTFVVILRPWSRSRSNWNGSSWSWSTNCPVGINWSRSRRRSPWSRANCPRATNSVWSSMRRRA